MKTRFIMIALFVLNIIQMSAQSNDEVTLVVSADGATKEEATKVALRSAIEQAYGTFVSANTTILNDEMVKDEIVTISAGNIKNYKELSYSTLQDGRSYLTLQATISLSNLTKYAQNKGATTEFAGAAFGMNMKMMELNKENEKKVLHHMIEKLNSIDNMFDYSLVLNEPTVNPHYYIKELPEKDYPLYYFVRGTISLIYNINTELYNDILYNTIKSIALTYDDYENYRKKGIEVYHSGTLADGTSVFLRNEYPGWNITADEIFGDNGYKKREKYLESLGECSEIKICHFSPANISLNASSWSMIGMNILAKDALSFIISDNLSSPTSLNIFVRNDLKFYSDMWSYKKTITENSWTGKKKAAIIKTKIGEKVGEIEVLLVIPKEDIGKYNKFMIK